MRRCAKLTILKQI